MKESLYIHKLSTESIRTVVGTTIAVLLFLITTYVSLSQSYWQDRINRISWSPDGSKIAIAGGGIGCDPAKRDTEYVVRLFDPITNSVVNTFLPQHHCRLIDIAWSPDGNKIASSSDDGSMLIWDVMTGTRIGYSQISAQIGLSVVWSPDSTKIVSIGSGGEYATTWDAVTGERLYNTPSHDDTTTSVVWSPDGNKIATSSNDNTIQIADVTQIPPIVAMTLQYTASLYSVDWSSDSTKLASGSIDGTIQIWDATIAAPSLDVLTGHTDAVEMVVWSPDGSQLASGSTDGTVRIWDAATGNQLDIIQSTVGTVHQVAWHPNGNQLSILVIIASLKEISLKSLMYRKLPPAIPPPQPGM